MDTDILEQLKSLHTHAIDARNGYREALEDAKGKGLSPLFRDMIALHESNAAELARELFGTSWIKLEVIARMNHDFIAASWSKRDL